MSNSDNWPAPEINSPSPIKYASFWMRALAHLCDGLMVAIVIVPLSILLAVVTGQSQSSATMSSITSIIGLALQSYWIGTKGRSPLRVKLGVLVVDANTGAFIGLNRAILRTVVTNAFAIFVIFNAILGILPLVDFLWMLRDPQSQTLHDKVARTVVQQA